MQRGGAPRNESEAQASHPPSPVPLAATATPGGSVSRTCAARLIDGSLPPPMRRLVSSMSADSQGPVRTCVGCRQRAAKRELLRVVVGDRDAALEVVPDPTGRAPGRGAHLHPTAECLGLALRRRAFPRALRVPGRLDTTVLEVYVRDAAVADSDSTDVRPIVTPAGGRRGPAPVGTDRNGSTSS